MADLKVSSRISIPDGELSFTFSRSPGPGGQNVNKVNSQATLKWNQADSQALPQTVHERFVLQNANRINKLGQVVITSGRFREQPRNIADCLERLKKMLLKALVVPKRRRKTRPSAGSVRRRLSDKKKLSKKKQERRPGSGD